MEYEKCKFQPTEYHTIDYINSHPYSYQNDLLKQHNFPLYYYRSKCGEHGDFATGFYEDRTWSWEGHWTEALSRLSPEVYVRVSPMLAYGVLGFSRISVRDMLALLQAKYPDKNIVGFRLIRSINVSNGYPCDYLECFGKADDTPAMEFGPNLAFNHCPEAKDRAHMLEYRGTF